MRGTMLIEYKCGGCDNIHTVKAEAPGGLLDIVATAVIDALIRANNPEPPTVFIIDEDNVKTDVTVEAMALWMVATL